MLDMQLLDRHSLQKNGAAILLHKSTGLLYYVYVHVAYCIKIKVYTLCSVLVWQLGYGFEFVYREPNVNRTL